jgi:hypothetical protein
MGVDGDSTARIPGESSITEARERLRARHGC